MPLETIARVAGVGVSCPLAHNALQLGLLSRALTRAPTVQLDTVGGSVSCCRDPWLDPELEGDERFYAMGVPALVSTRANAAVELFVALPGPAREGEAEFAACLAERAGLQLAAPAREFRLDRWGAVVALREAVARLSETGVDVVVGGIDSRLGERQHAQREEWVPGEAAAFVRLTQRQDRRSLGSYHGCFTGDDALKMAKHVDHAVPWLLSSGSGSVADRLAWAQWRGDATHAPGQDRFLASQLGDTGAAAAPLIWVMAVARWATRTAPQPRAWVAIDSAAGRGCWLISGPRDHP